MNIYIMKFNLVNMCLSSFLLFLIVFFLLLPHFEELKIEAMRNLTPGIIGFSMSEDVPGNTWGMVPTNEIDIFAPLKKNKGGQVPLPEGKLNFWYANEFRPECCLIPQQYSTSTGCACISVDQMRFLNERGGNNVLEPL